MSRLKAALIREYESDPTHNIEIHNPRNTVSVDLYFRGEKMAKVMGSLAVQVKVDEINLVTKIEIFFELLDDEMV